jgi:hypothetical protein
MRELTNTYTIFDGKTERKDHLEDQELDGKINVNLSLRLTKQHNMKLCGEWRHSFTRSLSRQ